MSKYDDNLEEIFQFYQQGYTQRQITKLMTFKHGVRYDQSSIGKILRTHPDYKSKRNFGNIGYNKAVIPMPDWYVENQPEQIMKQSGVINGVDAEIHSVWDKSSKDYSILYRVTKDVMTFEQMREEFIQEMKEHSPEYKKYVRKPIKDKHLLVIDPSDIHVNKKATKEETGEEYNSEIAVKRVNQAIESILQKSSGFPLEKIVLVIGNDVLNTDNINNATTKGTPQDVSHRWYEGFRLAKKMYVDVIERLIAICDVEVYHVMSNHDYISGWMLADSIYSWFRKCENVTFNLDVKHRKYLKWGNNLIGLSHGDKFKSMDAPLLMANEAARDWAETYYRYFYLHHIHHHNKVKFQSGKDYRGVTVQHLRSPSPADLWHYDSSYCHSKQAIEAFIHHETDGQVCCITHNF